MYSPSPNYYNDTEVWDDDCGGPEPSLEEKIQLDKSSRRIFRIRRPEPWKVVWLSEYKRRRLEPFVHALAALLITDLHRFPPAVQ